MSASLRIELFPLDLEECISFYTDILRFTLIKRTPGYAYMQRDSIFIGLDTSHHTEQQLGHVDKEARRPPTGVEIVLEVEDVAAELNTVASKYHDSVTPKSWTLLENGLKLQAWGLRDFRMLDPDGYYLRITECTRNQSKSQRRYKMMGEDEGHDACR